MTRTTLDTGICNSHDTLTNAREHDAPNFRVGDLLKDDYQNGQMAMSTRDPNKSQRFLVTAIDADGTIHLRPVHA